LADAKVSRTATGVLNVGKWSEGPFSEGHTMDQRPQVGRGHHQPVTSHRGMHAHCQQTGIAIVGSVEAIIPAPCMPIAASSRCHAAAVPTHADPPHALRVVTIVPLRVGVGPDYRMAVSASS
jgi:hypothetical protein